MSNLPVSQFEQGDIILFRADFSKPKEDWISIAIALLTKSDVSHSALYMGNEIISDEASNGLGKRIISDVNGILPIYIKRLLNPTDKAPVLNVANTFLSDDEPYDYPALVLLGLLLVYEDVSTSQIPEKLLLPILKYASSALDKWLQNKRNPGKAAMVCSQYVYECYKEAGSFYQLNCNNTILSNSPKNQNLLSYIYNHVANRVQSSLNESSNFQNEVNIQDIINPEFGEAFLKELNAIENHQSSCESTKPTSNLIHCILNLSDKIYELFHDTDASIDSFKKLEFCKSISRNSLFITPADLKNCSNLETVGESMITRTDMNK
jgi:hypothetical protein